MKILVIKSSYSDNPIAEVRTDGRSLDFIVDNTNGKLPRETGGQYDKLVQMVKNSSHMTMEEPQQATVGMHRYLLDNGDVVEVTTDGKSAILNGRMLEPQERDALFGAVKRGEIKVKRKADIQQPIPIIAAQQKAPALPKPPTGFNPMITDELKRQAQKRREAEKQATSAYDELIEQADLRGAEDPEYTKKLLYQLKYGGQ